MNVDAAASAVWLSQNADTIGIQICRITAERILSDTRRIDNEVNVRTRLPSLQSTSLGIAQSQHNHAGRGDIPLRDYELQGCVFRCAHPISLGAG